MAVYSPAHGEHGTSEGVFESKAGQLRLRLFFALSNLTDVIELDGIPQGPTKDTRDGCFKSGHHNPSS